MKKNIFTLLCAVLGYSAVYASFPVTQERVVEYVEIEDPTKTLPASDPTPLADWSFLLGVLWIPFLLIGGYFQEEGPEENAITFWILAIASFIGAPIAGIMSLVRKEGKEWKPIIGFALTLGIPVLILMLASISLGF